MGDVPVAVMPVWLWTEGKGGGGVDGGRGWPTDTCLWSPDMKAVPLLQL